MSLAPVPSEQPDADPAARTARRRSRPTSATAWPAASPSRPCGWRSWTCSRPSAQPYGGAGQAPVGALPPGYAPVIEPRPERHAWLRRYSGLFGSAVGALAGDRRRPARRPLGHAEQSAQPAGRCASKVWAASPRAPAAAASTTAAERPPRPQPAATSHASRDREQSRGQDRSPRSCRKPKRRKSSRLRRR